MGDLICSFNTAILGIPIRSMGNNNSSEIDRGYLQYRRLLEFLWTRQVAKHSTTL